MINLNETEYVVCRPALPLDTAQVMELCSHIWDGGDYIPKVWSEWLADPNGLLGVAELKGRVAGVFKLTKFQDKEWYMEGLRVHPDFQGKGIAAHIHEYVIETWRRMGSGVVRLVTHSENVKVHRMCERSGFNRIAEFIPYQTSSLQESSSSFTFVKNDETHKALDLVLNSPAHALSAGLINLGWVFADPRPKHLEEVIGSKHAWWWRQGAGFISISEDDEAGEREPCIQLIACSIEALTDLLVDYRRLMGDIGYKTAGWVAPNKPEALSCIEKAGFKRGWDKSIYIYELSSKEV